MAMEMAATRTVILGSFAFFVFWLTATFPSFRGLPVGRTAGAVVSAALIVVFQVDSPDEAYAAVNLPILGLLFGTMVVSVYLQRADMFKYLASALSYRCQGGRDLLCRLCFLVAFISALFTNDTCCVLLTDFILAFCKEKGLPPEPFLLALASSANIGSSATPIGNPQNLVIAIQSKISFGKFLLGILPAMVVGVSLNLVLLLAMYWKQLSHMSVRAGEARGAELPEIRRAGHQQQQQSSRDIEEGDDQKQQSDRDIEEGKDDKQQSDRNVEEGEDRTQQADRDFREGGDENQQSDRVFKEGNDENQQSDRDVEKGEDRTQRVMDSQNALQIGQTAGSRISIRNGNADPSSPMSVHSSPSSPSFVPARNHNRAKLWKHRLWKLSVYAVTLGMLAALLAGLNLSWCAITAAVALIVLDFEDAAPSLGKVSYSLLVFFSGMFITVDGFNRTGVPGRFWQAVEPYARINHASGTAVLTAVIILLSNVASNVPTVLLLGPKVAASSAAIPGVSVTRAWLILAWASTVGGNLTLVGSAANLIVCEQARMADTMPYNLSFWRHLRFGLPSTLLTVAAGLPLIRA